MNHELFAAHARAREAFLPLRNVIGVGVGAKVTRGRVAGRESIVVLVDRKLTRDLVPVDELIPPLFGGYPTDVREPVLEVPPDPGGPFAGDWCRTDVRWIDWAKVHRMKAPRRKKRQRVTEPKPKPRRSRGDD